MRGEGGERGGIRTDVGAADARYRRGHVVYFEFCSVDVYLLVLFTLAFHCSIVE